MRYVRVNGGKTRLGQGLSKHMKNMDSDSDIEMESPDNNETNLDILRKALADISIKGSAKGVKTAVAKKGPRYITL